MASRGAAPAQIMDFDEFETKAAVNTSVSSGDDFDEEFYGSSEYNDDEFDAAGFDEMTFDENM